MFYKNGGISMKNLSIGKIVLIVVLVLLVFIIGGSVSSYNKLVGYRESVDNQRANIDTQLQRRFDLIPNLVNTVKGYASHETKIMTDIADARSKLMGAQSMTDKADADSALNSALSRLLMVVENYPDLKADKQYTALMDELSGTENRIAVSRKDYNDAVKLYNRKIQSFPSTIYAGIFGFDKADYFTASSGSDTPPTVDFEK